jgi:hypothetical protein
VIWLDWAPDDYNEFSFIRANWELYSITKYMGIQVISGVSNGQIYRPFGKETTAFTREWDSGYSASLKF